MTGEVDSRDKGWPREQTAGTSVGQWMAVAAVGHGAGGAVAPGAAAYRGMGDSVPAVCQVLPVWQANAPAHAARNARALMSTSAHGAVHCEAQPSKVQVVIGRGLTPVKILFRLRLQKFVPCIIVQPFVRVLITG